jgi:hypothetical protein
MILTEQLDSLPPDLLLLLFEDRPIFRVDSVGNDVSEHFQMTGGTCRESLPFNLWVTLVGPFHLQVPFRVVFADLHPQVKLDMAICGLVRPAIQVSFLQRLLAKFTTSRPVHVLW